MVMNKLSRNQRLNQKIELCVLKKLVRSRGMMYLGDLESIATIQWKSSKKKEILSWKMSRKVEKLGFPLKSTGINQSKIRNKCPKPFSIKFSCFSVYYTEKETRRVSCTIDLLPTFSQRFHYFLQRSFPSLQNSLRYRLNFHHGSARHAL